MTDDQDRLGWEYPPSYTDEEGKKHLLGPLSPAMIEDIKRLHAQGMAVLPEVIEQLDRQGVTLHDHARDRRRPQGGIKIHIHR